MRNFQVKNKLINLLDNYLFFIYILNIFNLIKSFFDLIINYIKMNKSRYKYYFHDTKFI